MKGVQGSIFLWFLCYRQKYSGTRLIRTRKVYARYNTLIHGILYTMILSALSGTGGGVRVMKRALRKKKRGLMLYR